MFSALLEKSLVYQYWEYFLIILISVYFLSRAFNKKVESENSDESKIEEDAKNENDLEDEGDLTPSLEVLEHVKYPGATVTLSGGIDEFYRIVNDRRSIRKFSKKPVDIEIVKKAILCAGTSPSGKLIYI